MFTSWEQVQTWFGKPSNIPRNPQPWRYLALEWYREVCRLGLWTPAMESKFSPSVVGGEVLLRGEAIEPNASLWEHLYCDCRDAISALPAQKPLYAAPNTPDPSHHHARRKKVVRAEIDRTPEPKDKS